MCAYIAQTHSVFIQYVFVHVLLHAVHSTVCCRTCSVVSELGRDHISQLKEDDYSIKRELHSALIMYARIVEVSPPIELVHVCMHTSVIRWSGQQFSM